jgi:tetratricopeptide (TPR) repeat protein
LFLFLCVLDFDKAVKLIEGKLNNSTIGDSLVGHLFHHKLARSSSLLNVVHRQPSSVAISFAADNNDSSHSGPGSLDRRDSNASLRSGGSLPPLQRSHTAYLSTASSRGGHESAVLSSFCRKELEQQLGDTLYKRAQAKLMIEADSLNIEAALSDVMKAIGHYSDDDDFHLVAATCHIRLQRYSNAMQILESVLERSPTNYKALYNLAFCRRAEGSQKDAIEGLTKIISYSNNEIESFTANTINVPIHRVYEMRGTLFHEVQGEIGILLCVGILLMSINSSQICFDGFRKSSCY